MIKDADAGAIILAIVGSLLVGGAAYALQRLSSYRNEKDIIPKIKSGELTERDFVQAYREQAINRIKINEDEIIAKAEDHLFSTEDVVNLTKVELLKLKRELYRAKSINDLISIFPNDASLKRMKYLFDKSKLTKDSKVVTMNLKRYIDAAVRREVRRRLDEDNFNQYQKLGNDMTFTSIKAKKIPDIGGGLSYALNKIAGFLLNGDSKKAYHGIIVTSDKIKSDMRNSPNYSRDLYSILYDIQNTKEQLKEIK